MSGSGDLVVTASDGTRITWDASGNVNLGSADGEFASAIEAARNTPDGNLRSPGTAGSHQGVKYDVGDMPPENKTVYIELGAGESLWTVAEDLGLDAQGWWKLVSNNPQFQDPDAIPVGAVVMVNVDDLPQDHPLRSDLSLGDDGGVGASSEETANSFIELAQGGSTDEALASDFASDLAAVSEDDRADVISRILTSTIADEKKILAVTQYLDLLGVTTDGAANPHGSPASEVVGIYNAYKNDPNNTTEADQRLEQAFPTNPPLSAEIVSRNSAIHELIRSAAGVS